MTLRVGLLVNPIAGIGGQAGFKGSDQHWRKALEQGIKPGAGERAMRFVEAVGDAVSWTAPPGAMGAAYIATDDPADVTLVLEGESFAVGHTEAGDTRRAALELAESNLDLICFVGGDGTAADVSAAIADKTPCLGIPAGVKITSPVFSHSPEEAASLVQALKPQFETVPRDVTDLDEAAYRAGSLQVELRGSLVVPLSPFVQDAKSPIPVDTPLEPLVDQVIADWPTTSPVLVGAGSVCLAIKKQFTGTPALLGVDAILDGAIVQSDLTGQDIENFVAKNEGVRILLSIVGGQGMLIGRGTQVFTPLALRTIGWERIDVVAPPEKLLGLGALYVDSGDSRFDASAPDYIRVRSGWNETRMLKIKSGAKP